MKNRVLIIIGSSRNDGDTKMLVNELVNISNYDSVDLNDYNISYYDYSHNNSGDDYLGLMKKLISGYDTLLFATPVYWYAMSGVMKIFFDRITDLLDNEKELGRKLRGKKMAAISTSIGDNLGEHFWLPFIETANYLGMTYIGHLHTIANQIDKPALRKFVENIDKN